MLVSQSDEWGDVVRSNLDHDHVGFLYVPDRARVALKLPEHLAAAQAWDGIIEVLDHAAGYAREVRSGELRRGRAVALGPVRHGVTQCC